MTQPISTSPPPVAVPSGTGDAGHPKAFGPVVHTKPWGSIIAAVIIVALIVLLVIGLSGARIQWEDIPGFLFSSIMLEGLGNTIIMSICAFALAVVVGLFVAIARLSQNVVLRWLAGGWVWLFRGLPALVQLLIWYNLALAFRAITLPNPFSAEPFFSVATNDLMTPFVVALLGLGLAESAYMAEIIRAGILSVDPGQTEAAKAIGMTPRQTLSRVVLPQALRFVIPPTGNQFIGMVKLTSLASVITFTELIHAAANISSANLEVMETLLAAAIWYLAIVTVLTILQSLLEKRIGRAHSRAATSRRTRARVDAKEVQPA